MRLSKNFITLHIGDHCLVRPAGPERIPYMICNETAGFIVECLKEDTTAEAITDAMLVLYDEPREVLAAGVDKMMDILRSMHALEE